jgi:hypothetical protein
MDYYAANALGKGWGFGLSTPEANGLGSAAGTSIGYVDTRHFHAFPETFRIQWPQRMPTRAHLTLWTTLAAATAGLLFAGRALADLAETMAPQAQHPAIASDSTPSHDPVAELNRKLQNGSAHLTFENGSGYLRSVLQALNVPIESQIAVFSKTSLQLERINPSNPRTLFFNDSVAVGWMGGGMIELAAHDPRQGVKFYTLQQRSVTRPEFAPDTTCLRCHIADASLGVPGMIVRSMYTAPDGSTRLIFGGSFSDHRSPFPERYGGWYVTGDTGAAHHLGNVTIMPEDTPEALASAPAIHLDALPIADGLYLSRYSDIAALLTFDHQMHMINLITRIGWEARVVSTRGAGVVLEDAAAEFVDYLLFIDEAPLPSRMRGTSGFYEAFAARGPFDQRGRSLRQLDLDTRLLKYPCSYMIYSEAFDALPAEAKAAIYKRMWQVLSGWGDKRYARLTPADRRAVVEILRDTKKDLPDYFKSVAR